MCFLIYTGPLLLGILTSGIQAVFALANNGIYACKWLGKIVIVSPGSLHELKLLGDIFLEAHEEQANTAGWLPGKVAITANIVIGNASSYDAVLQLFLQ